MICIGTWIKVAIVAALLACIGIQTLRLSRAETALVSEQRDRATEKAEAIRVALAQSEAFRLKEQARDSDKEKVIRNAKLQASQNRASAAAASAAGDRLQQRIDSLLAASREPASDSCSRERSAAAAASELVLAQLLGSLREEAGRMALEADQSRTAGEACERSYDSLATPP